MWKDYSISYIKNNRTASISVMAAAFIATLFLSLLCTSFFNAWTYEIERIQLEEGDWQGRITGNIDEEDLEMIQNFANVEKAVINETLSDDKTVVDIYFIGARTIYHDMPLITAKLGLQENAAQYHSLLLSRYFIHDPRDKEPPMLLGFFVVILLIVSVSLILVIHNSFEISMNARIFQFGILSSVGATPKQIRTCLLQEASALCAVPILAGCLLGIGLSYLVIDSVNIFAANVSGRHQAVFRYSPIVFLVTFLIAVLTVLVSAWIPARKLSKITPLEAIRNSNELCLKKEKNSRILSWMFGIEGELAGNALKAQKKSLRIASVSFLLSCLGLTVMLCFLSLSEISTRYSYFERYQNVWDVMVTVKNTQLNDLSLVKQVKNIQGVRDCIAYEKEEMTSLISDDWQSEELLGLGGIGTVAGESVKRADDCFKVPSTIVIMDDDSFLNYCSQLGITPSLDGVIILNQIWDSINSNFREKKYVPYVKENRKTTALCGISGVPIEVPILSYTQEAPVLREEYNNYSLVHFFPLSAWNGISNEINKAKVTTYIRILANERTDLDKLNSLEASVVQLLGQSYNIESENKIAEKESNDSIRRGLKLLLACFCGLLAIIGIANVFSNTMGFLRQRRREFARYLSIGLTPSGMRKIFFIEALVIACRPILITLPLTAAAAVFMVNASHLDPMVFLEAAPIIPILIFFLVIFGFVSLAYYFGGKQVLNCNLNEVLRDDTVM